MDKSILTDTLNAMKERLSSPIFGTFLISFLIWNWEIPVGLFLPLEQLQSLKYDNYFDLINKHSKWVAFIFPTLFTLFYAIPFPFIKNHLKSWNDYSEKHADNYWLNRVKNVSIPISKYFTLRKDYENNLEQLLTVIASESKYMNEKSDLNTKLLQLENTVNIYESMNNYNNLDYYQGMFLINNLLGNGLTEQTYLIENNRLHPVINNRKLPHIATISSIAFNNLRNELLLIIIDNSINLIIPHCLKIFPNEKEWKGIILLGNSTDTPKISSFLKI